MTIENYREYLQTLHYSQSAIINYPRQVGEYLNYLKREGISDLKNQTSQTLENYFEYLSSRKNLKKEGTLSGVYLNSHRSSLVSFFKYLNLTQGYQIQSIAALSREKRNIPVVLTREEIERLYKAVEEEKNYPTSLRDKVILGLCYGAGLRKSECSGVDTSHVLFKEKLLHIPKGKGSQQRYVPLTKKILEGIDDYLKYGRPYFERVGSGAALLLGSQGARMESYYYRLGILCRRAGIEKEISTHTLRHSIATHLMEGGMEIEQIAKFLGHRSLESTQLYTHITHENI